MATNTLFSFCTFTILFMLLLNKNTSARPLAISWPPAQAPSTPDMANNSTEFIRSSCQKTLYPDLCFASLARYDSVVQQNPVHLARIAVKLSYSQIHNTKAHLSAYLRNSTRTITGPEAAALGDCVDSLGDAADQAKRSAGEMGKLERDAVGPEVAWRVSNAQTWMSAALTNEETCTDGFDEVEPGRIKADVCGRVGQVKMYTSIALALVNCLVNGGP